MAKQIRMKKASETLKQLSIDIGTLEQNHESNKRQLKKANFLLKTVSEIMEEKGIDEFDDDATSLLLHQINEYLYS